MTSRAKDPLEPFSTAISLAAALLAALVVASLAGTLFGSGHVLGVGGDKVCVEISAPGWAAQDADGTYRTSDDWLEELKKDTVSGVTAHNRTIELCTGQPTPAQSALNTLTMLPSFALQVLLLFLFLRLIRTVRADGLLSPAVPGGLRRAAWALVLGCYPVPAVERASETALVSTLTTPDGLLHPPPAQVLLSALTALSPVLLLCGLGLFTLARLLRTHLPDPAPAEDLTP